MEIVFATGNNGKLKEVREIFSDLDVKINSLNDFKENIDVIEDGKSFEENALKKAEEVQHLLKLPVISDDSGLEVEQLNRAPGIYSARYSGEDATYEKNNQKLIEELKKFQQPHLAKFVCAAAFSDGINRLVVRGEFKGQIISEARGKNGFGYDPLFLPEGLDKTSAEISSELKNKISHRAKAFNKLKEMLIENKLI
ncbi:MAG: non-canonical purine NTP pyrophosphatase, RdgB/HAM1 family [Ignavibacteriales bacterium CG12_big_fil_rev_8_21_14_0_65_30_8]|nr:MAG: non-canonical purine NTP pyrophosphatase, RdgB/HAM1 family [Ignavibacteriales bacterium CG12_big_fil_rev_8_21_14_0_65_30_8]